MAAVVCLRDRRDRVRHRDGCLVAADHRCRARRDRPDGSSLRVLPGPARPLSLVRAPARWCGSRGRVHLLVTLSGVGGSLRPRSAVFSPLRELVHVPSVPFLPAPSARRPGLCRRPRRQPGCLLDRSQRTGDQG
ncbi:hypothetical protein NOCARDAX2BIS_330045 [Nocardioides sp. AX2bis]|nr:hypothetical protein NOCARDAX2BIS_330045 [Nocardioides sp. AX2bis]